MSSRKDKTRTPLMVGSFGRLFYIGSTVMTFCAESNSDREYMVWRGPTRAMMPANDALFRAAEALTGLLVFLLLGAGMELPKTSSRVPGGL